MWRTSNGWLAIRATCACPRGQDAQMGGGPPSRESRIENGGAARNGLEEDGLIWRSSYAGQ